MIVENICNVNDFVRVCVVCGVGGIGKTTLAQLVYKDERVDKLFDLKVWLHVSNDFSIVKVICFICYIWKWNCCNNGFKRDYRGGYFFWFWMGLRMRSTRRSGMD